MNARFRVPVLAIKNFDEKSQIVRPGRSETVAIDGGELFFHRRTQIFFAERLLATELDGGRRLGVFFLLFGDNVFLFLFFLGPRSVDRRLRCQLDRSHQVAQKKETVAAHHLKRIRYFTIPR